MTISVAAKRIADAVLNALQDADELGGVEDRAEYIALMDYIAQECRKRAETAEETDPRREILEAVREVTGVDAADIWETSGGCTAIGIPVTDNAGRGAHWLITDGDHAPESTEVALQVGYYHGDHWFCFTVPNLERAFALLQGFESSSF